MHKNPLVSVCMITYNQEDFIAEAIKGVAKQVTDFDFEFIIANDASTDKSDQIISEMISKISNCKIKYLKNEFNVGMMANFKRALGQCKGKYVALCEGDDYWTDPLKLQKQVEFLEERPECSFGFHKAYKLGENGRKEVFPQNSQLSVLNISEFFGINTIPTCSVMFKNRPIKSIGELAHKNGDFLLYCELLHFGSAGFLEEIMGVYRKHGGGISYNNSSREYLTQRIKELKKELKYFSDKEVKLEIGNLYRRHILRYFQLYKNTSFLLKLYLKKELFFNVSYQKVIFQNIRKKMKLKLKGFQVYSRILFGKKRKRPPISGECSLCQKKVGFHPLPEYFLKNYAYYQLDYSLSQFETLNIEKYSCSNCGASDRDRLIGLYLNYFFNKIGEKRIKFIDFGPSGSIEKFMKKQISTDYLTADLYRDDVDEKVDIRNMCKFADNSFDGFICSHVLEHIEEDEMAIKELYRITKKGGTGLLLVPIVMGLQKSVENPEYLKSEHLRWKYFGQGDHVRMYAKSDFVERLLNAGFQVSECGEHFFGKDIFNTAGILPRSVLYVVEK